MPSGYTAALYEGKPQTFEEFALGCARAFGALITMRDEAPDAPIPDEFEPAPWYRESLVKSRARLQELRDLTTEEWEARAQEEVASWNRHVEEIEARNAEMRLRYEAMLAEAERWVPPTEEHQGLKDFMVEQLRESIRFDCGGGSWLQRRAPMSAEEFREQELRHAREALVRDLREFREENKRVAGRNAWVRALRESLAERSTVSAEGGA